jgi:hypothetical protein
MLKKSIFFLIFATLFFGCKSKNESDGDSYYKNGKFRNAVNSYVEARKKGKISDEFYDNFIVAYASAAKQTAQRSATDVYINLCIEQIHKYIPNTKKATTLDSVVVGLSEISIFQVKVDDYEYTLQGFRNIDSAINIAKRNNVASIAYAQKTRKDMEDLVVKRAIENSDGAASTVATEYVLLEAEVLAPNNEELQKALNNIRPKNRADFLIFEAAGIEKPSRLVNKYGYVISFPSISIESTGTTAEVAIWNSTGNNVDFDFSKLKMVSTKGEEVYPKVNSGICYMSDHLGKAKGPIKGSVGKLLSELMCLVKLSYSYKSDFVPNYVDYKDENNNIGRKYLGYK